ncbi:MAG TPA: CvpA family protein [Ramlibacter sp.]|uniref:CvpA family protein n=1 Tax=Ramlibacter sp. TaxID=1917967 RepID=UPI002C1C8010|nr:CvpA family protein [Ramlibacter sp.]HVZ42512.1 CvpA family protein [Ramlibacter sp.]
MAALDWVIVGVLAVSVLLGLLRGLVYEVISVLSWIAAFVLAQWLAPDVSQMLPMGSSGASIRYAAAFVLVFVLALFAGGLVAWLVKKMVEAVGLKPIDRALGAIFGLARGVVLVLVFAVVVSLTPLKDGEWWNESKSAEVAQAALRGLQPVLPEQFGRYIPDSI